MITPYFKVEQNPTQIIITIKLKYVRISDVDFFIDKNNFRFHLKPYFLNLFFSHNIKDSEKNSSNYNHEKGILTCCLEKENKEEIFENLELLSNLLNDEKEKEKEKEKVIGKKLNKIQEIENDLNNLDLNSYSNINNYNTDNNDSIENIEKEKEEIFYRNLKNFLEKKFEREEFNSFYFNYLCDMEFNSKEKNNFFNKKENFSYGFDNNYFDVYTNRQEELLEICDINPEKTEIFQRIFEKINLENKDFIAERYICDMDLKEENPQIFSYDLDKFFKNQIKNNPLNSLFTEKEQNLLFNLKKIKVNLKIDDDENQLEKLIEINMNLNLSNNNNSNGHLKLNNYGLHKLKFEFYLQIIDILFAFLYDFRINDLEQTSESGWCINKLSNTLSCNVNFRNIFYSYSNEPPFDLLENLLKNLLINCYRRILVYPLYRNLDLCEIIKKDLKFILSKGIEYIMKCLINCRIAFERSEPRFILNEIYIDQLIKWVQSSNLSIWNIILNVINDKDFVINKEDLKLNLEEIEKEYFE
jgi:protein SHQ1